MPFEWGKIECNWSTEHLIYDGFLRSYTIWTWHDELIDFPNVSQIKHLVDSTMEERREEQLEEYNLEDMIQNVGAEAFAQVHVYETMSTNAKTLLCVG